MLLANVAVWVGRQARSWFATDPLPDLPPVMLWAWERPEDLSFLDCEEAGVAFLAKTILINDDAVSEHPRMQPLKIPEACPVVAVIRIEAGPSALSSRHVDAVAPRILAVTRQGDLSVVQIDFDALASQRAFYRELLGRLRDELPPHCRLTVTALASWCIWDGWIADLPIDDAVPMLFRMGADEDRIRRYLESGEDLRVEACCSSAGISTDEPLPRAMPGRRRYIFHPRPWSEEAASDILKRTRWW